MSHEIDKFNLEGPIPGEEATKIAETIGRGKDQPIYDLLPPNLSADIITTKKIPTDGLPEQGKITREVIPRSPISIISGRSDQTPQTANEKFMTTGGPEKTQEEISAYLSRLTNEGLQELDDDIFKIENPLVDRFRRLTEQEQLDLAQTNNLKSLLSKEILRRRDAGLLPQQNPE